MIENTLAAAGVGLAELSLAMGGDCVLSAFELILTLQRVALGGRWRECRVCPGNFAPTSGSCHRTKAAAFR
jgi:hypothetical protein